MKKVTLAIAGMTCSACSSGLEKHLNKQNGISSASVNLVLANATIEYDETLVTPKMLDEFIKKAGFKSTGIYNINAEQKSNKLKKIWFITFGVLAIILLYVSMGHMIGLPLPNFLSPKHSPKGYAITLFVLVIPFLVYGFDIFLSGIKNLIHLKPNMDTLVTLGVFSSFIFSIYLMITIFLGNASNAHNLYFESCAIIVYFIKLGRNIDSFSKVKTKQAVMDLVTITPNNAKILVDGKVKTVTIDEIKYGDIVVCHAGEKIAVDGVVTKGNAHVNDAFLTGESKPATKTVGSQVMAGSINLNGYLEFKATKIGKDSTISEIVNLVVEATNTKMPISKTADKVSGIFVPVVMALALITFIVYLILGYSFANALTTFVTVLVVACPCSLGLATPLAVVISVGECAKSGILVKKSETLEVANKINTVVFDKTGTLTFGTLKIANIINYSNLSDSDIIKLAASVESKSNHPIASAFSEKLKELNLDPLEIKDFKELSGLGICATVDGCDIKLGNNKLLKHFKIKNNHLADEQLLSESGCSIVYVVKDNKIIALIGVSDLINTTATETVNKLIKSGIEVIMLTGDNEQVANLIASKLGITNVIASVLPTKKAEVITNLKKQGKKVLMCGDGINDSPALAKADIGVSVSGGSDIAINSADVVLLNNNLNKISELITLSKRTIRNIKQNLFWAFFYNGLMIPVAMGVFSALNFTINPMLAGLAMVLSSLTVIANALTLKIKRRTKWKKNMLCKCSLFLTCIVNIA